ncbi:MAG: YheC/YheD family protein [Firmicutes bacterium]|nr:YheC/YheD family protein [Bacillota bacterium]
MKVMVALGKRSILGPLVGILSAENEDGSLKGNFNNYKDIMEAGQKIGGIVFAFTPSSVNWEKRSIQGSIFDKLNKQWVTCSFPFPNVVYNRIQDRAHENIESSQSCIQRFLSQPAISLYNRGFFNKEEIIAALSKSAKINKNIPETIALQSQKDLVTMLERHSALYLKPIDARLGSGIIRVKKSQAKKAYIMHYYADDKQLKQYTAYNIRRLWKKIKKQRISSSYIVQQAVPLAHVSTCPFDCRVLVQKNRQGLWQLSGLGIRIAAHSQSITTHIPRGGRIGTAKNVLQQVFPQLNHKHIIKKVERLCIDVAERLEQHYHHLGEMSIDIGLDDNGKPWIFEANAKPMRFDEPEIREKQVGQVIFYAQFLTFNTSSRGH